MKPLVSILIPAYNAQDYLAETIQSAVNQTWAHKEVIILNDGSKDRTLDIAKGFAAKNVQVISTENHGLSAAVNAAYRNCQGDYIQELDADDILAPDKIERQLTALREPDNKRTLLSSPWAYFYYRTRMAKFVPNSFWRDLSPVEWLLIKLGQNLHMQNATWLVSREIADAAGPWDESLQYDQDGEYFARVLLASESVRFVPEGRVYYRVSGSNRISFIGNSRNKKESLLRSMKLHVQYIRSLEESQRVHQACLKYLQNWFGIFCSDFPEAVLELQGLAAQLNGSLESPRFSWKYAWMASLFGPEAARWGQRVLPEEKTNMQRRWDRFLFKLERRGLPS